LLSENKGKVLIYTFDKTFPFIFSFFSFYFLLGASCARHAGKGIEATDIIGCLHGPANV